VHLVQPLQHMVALCFEVPLEGLLQRRELATIREGEENEPFQS
jgi:hypothetical protein